MKIYRRIKSLDFQDDEMGKSLIDSFEMNLRNDIPIKISMVFSPKMLNGNRKLIRYSVEIVR